MEERKPLETKVRAPSSQGRFPFLVPAQWDPHSWTQLPWGPSSSLQRMGGQAQAEGRAKDIHGVSSMLRRKGGAVSLTREEPMVFPSIHTLLLVSHLFPGSWMSPHLKFRWLPSSSHPHQRTNPAILQAPPYPPHHVKPKRGQVTAGHNPIPHPSPLSFPNPQPHAARDMEHPLGTAEPLMVMVVHVVEVGGCHGTERG